MSCENIFLEMLYAWSYKVSRYCKSVGLKFIFFLVVLTQGCISVSYAQVVSQVTWQDHVTNLVWQDDSDAINLQKSWEDAVSYCGQIKLGGYDDWRLPNVYEHSTLLDNKKNKKPYSIAGLIKVKSSYYWTATTYPKDSTSAARIGFHNGAVDWDYKSGPYSKHNVRCVRGVEQKLNAETISKVFGKNIDQQLNKFYKEHADSMTQDCSNIYVGKLVKFRGGALGMEWNAIVLGVGSKVTTIKNISTGAIQQATCTALY